MPIFRKIWRALFSCNTRFEIRPFALLPTDYLFLVGSLLRHFKLIQIGNHKNKSKETLDYNCALSNKAKCMEILIAVLKLDSRLHFVYIQGLSPTCSIGFLFTASISILIQYS